jgi:hypothetical protein
MDQNMQDASQVMLPYEQKETTYSFSEAWLSEVKPVVCIK